MFSNKAHPQAVPHMTQPPSSRPCATSLGFLAEIDPWELSPAQRLDLVVELERHANWLEGVRLAALAAAAGPGPDFADHEPESQQQTVPEGQSRSQLPRPGWDAVMVQESIRDEVAAALRISGRAAERRITLARDLEYKLARTRDLLRTGECSPQHAAMVSEECERLNISDARYVEDCSLDNVGRQTPSQTRRVVRRRVARVCPKDPEVAIEEEFARRDVTMFHDGSVMATIVATLPAPDAIAVWNALTAVAHKNEDPRDSRSRAHKRADALTAWAHQAADDPELPVMQGKKRLETQVVIDAATLLGLAENPGELVGFGPIPATLARMLAADSGCWRRMVTDPVTGHLLDYGHRTYKPPAALREYVIARDKGCQFPGCSQPAQRCDLDHVEPFTGTPEGGLTSADNLISLCRRHHQLKTHHRWRVRVVKPPGVTSETGGRSTGDSHSPGIRVEWVSPRGMLHAVRRPAQLDGDALGRADQLDATADPRADQLDSGNAGGQRDSARSKGFKQFVLTTALEGTRLERRLLPAIMVA